MCYQKHGLNIIPRDTTSFTPLVTPEGKKAPASLTLGRDAAENARQIAQFSQKDAQVGGLLLCPACREGGNKR